MSGNRNGAPRRLTAWPGTVLLAVAVLLAGLVTILISTLSEGNGYLVYGLPDPGAVTFLGLPVLETVAVIGAAICTGSLLCAAFLLSPNDSGALTDAGRRAVRRASWAAGVWCLCAALAVPFTAAVELGEPVGQLAAGPRLAEVVGATEQSQAWLWTAGISLLLTIFAARTRSWPGAAGLLIAALLGLVPIAVSGHSSTGGAHDIATASLLYHLAAVTLWVGGLAALLAVAAHRGESPAVLALATTRFSRLALVCWLVVAGSGVLNAVVRMPIADLFDTLYGWLVTAKIGALLGLGGLGYLQRRHSVRAVRRGASASTLLRLGGGELLLMLATIGLAVALGHTPPPGTSTAPISITELFIGYPLDGPPSLTRLALDWRVDLVFAPLAVLLASTYLLGVRRLRRRGDRWPIARTASWLVGCLLVLVATSSGIGRYAPAMFSVHIGQNVLLALLAPALFVRGAPVTLAVRAIPAAPDGMWSGREWLSTVVTTRTVHLLTRPAVAIVVFLGWFAGLHLTGLFDVTVASHWAGLAVNAISLLTGFLLCWSTIGIDPPPNNMTRSARAVLGVAAGLGYAVVGVVLFERIDAVAGDTFYRNLALPWVASDAADQQLGGTLAITAGLLVVVVAVLAATLARTTPVRRLGTAPPDSDPLPPQDNP